MFAAVVSRSDIAFAVSSVSRFLDKPGREHWLAVKKMLRYVKGTISYGLLYGAKNDCLQGFTDSDYAGCVDTRITSINEWVYFHQSRCCYILDVSATTDCGNEHDRSGVSSSYRRS